MRLLASLAALIALVTAPAMATEEPSYTLVEAHGDIEIRDYPALILAEVEMSGDRREATNRGFRPLAGYIFGGNSPREEIAMTAPVTSTRAQGQEIAMTAPVTSEPGGEGSWRVSFIMPERWTLDSLPAPDDARVELREVPARRVAVIRFNGLMGERRVAEKLGELEAFLSEQGHSAAAPPTFAAYNPPWIPAPFRRNEIWIEISA
ncbi:MAG: heme-binding protein [Alphaproteobacteria bacterium]|nr:heme-binding protein [Alphaproteobacteria bacterium]